MQRFPPDGTPVFQHLLEARPAFTWRRSYLLLGLAIAILALPAAYDRQQAADHQRLPRGRRQGSTDGRLALDPFSGAS
jgi:hypothetical protein